MGKKRAVRRDGQATRGLILDASEALFAERGFFGTSIAAISDRCGVSTALIQHHFGGKRALWTQVKRRMVERFARAQALPAPKSALDAAAVRAALWAYFRFSLENPDALRFGMWVRLLGEDEEWGGEGEVFQSLMEVVRDAQEQGFFRSDVPPFDLMMAFGGMVRMWVLNQRHYSALVGQDPEDRSRDEAYFENAIKLLEPR